MIEERGRVIGRDGNLVRIETRRRAVCDTCAVRNGCGSALLAKLTGKKRTQVVAVDEIGVDVDDEVVIGIKEEALLRGSFAVYAVPILLMLVAAVLGDQLAGRLQLDPGDAVAAFSGLIGMLLGFAWLRMFSQRFLAEPNSQPVILRRLASVQH